MTPEKKKNVKNEDDEDTIEIEPIILSDDGKHFSIKEKFKKVISEITNACSTNKKFKPQRLTT